MFLLVNIAHFFKLERRESVLGLSFISLNGIWSDWFLGGLIQRL